MKKIIIRTPEDCPFFVYYDASWCTFPKDQIETEKDEYCALYYQSNFNCPLIEGLQIELENNNITK